MKISIIGTGNVGRSLASRALISGDDVIFGAHNPHSDNAIKATALSETVTLTSVDKAIATGDIIILAVHWSAIPSLLPTIAKNANKQSIIIDPVNGFMPDLSGLQLDNTTSVAESIQQQLPDHKVVKAFNTIGADDMTNPDYEDRKITAFIASDHDDAKQQVLSLAERWGFNSWDSGPLKSARYLEPMAMFWIDQAYLQQKGRSFGFHVLTR